MPSLFRRLCEESHCVSPFLMLGPSRRDAANQQQKTPKRVMNCMAWSLGDFCAGLLGFFVPCADGPFNRSLNVLDCPLTTMAVIFFYFVTLFGAFWVVTLVRHLFCFLFAWFLVVSCSPWLVSLRYLTFVRVPDTHRPAPSKKIMQDPI